MSGCISTPVSWMRLERYALGELAEGKDLVRRHLAECPACASCYARIEADAKLALPPLPAPRARAKAAARWRVIAGASTGLALAAAVVLAIVRVPRTERVPAEDTARARAKGDVFALTLVRDDAVRFDGARVTFRDGDRFKALVTCPPGALTRFDLVVYDDAGPSFPLAATAPLECGNDVALPGAFRLTGQAPMRVCVLWSDASNAPIDRAELARVGESAATSRGACKVLEPSP